MRPALLIPATLIMMASCGTLVRVVDADEKPVAGAGVEVVYPSFAATGPRETTDAEGYARIRDAWFRRPGFSMVPAWVYVWTDAGTWIFDYPPPDVLRLDPTQEHSQIVSRFRSTNQPAATQEAPQATRR